MMVNINVSFYKAVVEVLSDSKSIRLPLLAGWMTIYTVVRKVRRVKRRKDSFVIDSWPSLDMRLQCLVNGFSAT